MASKVTEYLQYHFTDAEKLDMATELSRTFQEQGTLENKKAELAKTLAGEIEVKKATITALARGISAGYEWRNIECIVQLDCPKQGEATLFRTDTGEAAKVRRMTAEEMQFQLDLHPAESDAGIQVSVIHEGETVWTGTSQEFDDAAASMRGEGDE